MSDDRQMEMPHHCPVLLQIYFHPYAIYGIEGIFHLFGAVLTSHPLNLQHHMMAVMIRIFVYPSRLWHVTASAAAGHQFFGITFHSNDNHNHQQRCQNRRCHISHKKPPFCPQAVCSSFPFGSRGRILVPLMATVDRLWKKAETVGCKMPASPSKSRDVLNPMIAL